MLPALALTWMFSSGPLGPVTVPLMCSPSGIWTSIPVTSPVVTTTGVQPF
jgi:hypothetical protein